MLMVTEIHWQTRKVKQKRLLTNLVTVRQKGTETLMHSNLVRLMHSQRTKETERRLATEIYLQMKKVRLMQKQMMMVRLMHSVTVTPMRKSLD
jgi:hypothetical protein